MSTGSRATLVVWVLAVGCASGDEGIAGDAGASACGQCHATEYAAWSTSRLAASGTSPVFEALSRSAAKEWGGAARARCVTCHQPNFGGDHGIGCVACHSATGNLEGRDGLLIVDLSAPLNGPFSDPVGTPAHGSRTYGFLESPALCGTCHEVTGPALVHETTLSEFEASRAAADGARCTTCHMPAVAPGPVAVDQSNTRPRKDHAFVGVDPRWGASASDQAVAAGRTLGLLQQGLILRATRASDRTQIDVELTNVAAHSVPTGTAFLRGIWVDVQFTGSNGASVTASKVIDLGAQPTRDGASVALITEADSVTSNDLASEASVSVSVPTPSSLPGPVSAVVTLRACAVRPEILDALGLADLAGEVPSHEVSIIRIP